MSEKPNEGVELGFGDLVQFGAPHPKTGTITWYALEVIVGGKPPHDLYGFAVSSNTAGEATIDMPGTTGGKFVRILGRLTIDEVRVVLARGWENTRPVVQADAMQTYTGDIQSPMRYDILSYDDATGSPLVSEA